MDIFQYSNLEFKMSEQLNDQKTQIEVLNEQLINLKMSYNTQKEQLPVNFNESIITELNTELNEKKVFKIALN